MNIENLRTIINECFKRKFKAETDFQTIEVNALRDEDSGSVIVCDKQDLSFGLFVTKSMLEDCKKTSAHYILLYSEDGEVYIFRWLNFKHLFMTRKIEHKLDDQRWVVNANQLLEKDKGSGKKKALVIHLTKEETEEIISPASEEKTPLQVKAEIMSQEDAKTIIESVKEEEQIDVVEDEITNDEFVHLHVHSHYSLLDGMATPKENAEMAKAHGQPGIALTDHGYMFGCFKHQQACNENDIKAIHGCEFYLVDDMTARERNFQYHINLLAMNEEGWKNIVYLNTMAGRDGFYYRPRIDKKIIAEHSEGVICMSACYKGEVAWFLCSEEHRNPSESAKRLKEYKGIFGDRFYVEVMHTDFPEYDNITPEIVDMAKSHGVKVVATNDTHYALQTDAEIQGVQIRINTGNRDDGLEFSGQEYFVKSREQMKRGIINDEFCDTSMEIFERCNYALEFSGSKFPKFYIDQCSDYEEFLEWRKANHDG